MQAPAGGIAQPDHHRRLIGNQPEPLFRFAEMFHSGLPFLFGIVSLEAEADLPGDR